MIFETSLYCTRTKTYVSDFQCLKIASNGPTPDSQKFQYDNAHKQLLGMPLSTTLSTTLITTLIMTLITTDHDTY